MSWWRAEWSNKPREEDTDALTTRSAKSGHINITNRLICILQLQLHFFKNHNGQVSIEFKSKSDQRDPFNVIDQLLLVTVPLDFLYFNYFK